jgi:hypothetical protein
MKASASSMRKDGSALDLCQRGHLLGLAANRRVMDDLGRAGFRGSPRSVLDLARRLGVEQQAASKVAALRLLGPRDAVRTRPARAGA